MTEVVHVHEQLAEINVIKLKQCFKLMPIRMFFCALIFPLLSSDSVSDSSKFLHSGIDKYFFRGAFRNERITMVYTHYSQKFLVQSVAMGLFQEWA